MENNHAFRNDEKSFDETKEKRMAPKPLSDSMILNILASFPIKFGKIVDNPPLPYNWKKKSIFFELSYWEDNLSHHNLDVMHIEKNVCEIMIGTLLNLDAKIRGYLKDRLDMMFMDIRLELNPKENKSNELIPLAYFSLKKKKNMHFVSS